MSTGQPLGEIICLKSISSLLETSVPPLMKMIGKQLKDKSVKTRLQAFKVLKEIATVLPEHIVSYVENFVLPITKALKVHHRSHSQTEMLVIYSRRDQAQRLS